MSLLQYNSLADAQDESDLSEVVPVANICCTAFAIKLYCSSLWKTALPPDFLPVCFVLKQL